MRESRWRCSDHQRQTAGCAECLAMVSRANRSLRRAEGKPVLENTARSEADDAYVAALVADLTDAGLEQEIRVSVVAERCAQILDDHVRRPS